MEIDENCEIIHDYKKNDRDVQLHNIRIENNKTERDPLIFVSHINHKLKMSHFSIFNIEKNDLDYKNNNNKNNDDIGNNENKNNKEKDENYENSEYRNKSYYLKEKYISENLDFPISKISDFTYNDKNLLITSDITINIYEYSYDGDNIEISKKSNLSREEEFLAPLTSFYNCEYNNKLLITSSYDTTCTLWDLEVEKTKEIIIAHDKEVYDVCFMKNEFNFLSCGADSSIRHFDLRDLDNLNILFEANECSGLSRIALCPFNDNYILTTCIDRFYFYLLDLRDLSCPVEIIKFHNEIVNNVCWNKNSENHFVSVSDDGYMCIWDLKKIQNQTPEYKCQYEDFINDCNWNQNIIALNMYDKIRLIKT